MRYFVSLISLSAVIICGPLVLQAQDNRTSVEPDTNRIGADYASFAASEVECRRRCRTDVNCRAYTFRRQSPWCWLKSQTQTPTFQAGYVSGVKGGVPDLSIVTVNMAGHSTLQDASVPGGADWKLRAERLADSIASLGPGKRPDIISLTETEGWRWCAPGTGVTVGDYDMIDRLIERLTAQTSVTYRIAYMVGYRGSFGWFGQCRYFSGDAVLYNPARLANRNLDDAQRFPAQARYDDALQGFQLRRSLPICNPGSARMPTARDLIDGIPRTDGCNRPLPSGPAWSWIYAAPEITLPISAVRFSFRHDLRTSFDLLTVHPMSERETQSRNAAILPFISAVTAAPYRLDLPFYSPVLVGDLNSLVDALDSINRFSQVFFSRDDVMTVRRGDRAAFPSLHDYRTVERRVLPADLAKRFSDHIALFARMSWVDPHDPSAVLISDFQDRTIVDEKGVRIWVIAGGAKFHIPDPNTHARLYGSEVSITVPPSGLDGIGRVPLTGTLLSEENGAIWVIAGGAKFHVPDLATLTRLFPDKSPFPLWNGAVGAISSAPRDGTLLREENGAIWVIAGGAKFHVPDLATLTRLFPDVTPFQLWNGALAAIPSIPANGTLLREESSTQVFRIRAGRKVPFAFGSAQLINVLWNGALKQIP